MEDNSEAEEDVDARLVRTPVPFNTPMPVLSVEGVGTGGTGIGGIMARTSCCHFSADTTRDCKKRKGSSEKRRGERVREEEEGTVALNERVCVCM